MTHFSLFATPIGHCGIAWRGDVVVATQLPEVSPAATAAKLAARLSATEANPPNKIQQAIRSITALLGGEKTDLNYISCDFGNINELAERVYAATRAIPCGETRTYGAIATEVGNKQLAQSVGGILGRNPLPIIVPCHRVIGASGKLTGFSAHGGVETKLNMLRIEGAQMGETLDLFD